jgi:hypothetical protein
LSDDIASPIPIDQRSTLPVCMFTLRNWLLFALRVKIAGVVVVLTVAAGKVVALSVDGMSDAESAPALSTPDAARAIPESPVRVRPAYVGVLVVVIPCARPIVTAPPVVPMLRPAPLPPNIDTLVSPVLAAHAKKEGA